MRESFGGSREGGREQQARKNHGPKVNEEIRYPEIRLIGDDGHAYGVVSIYEARRIAEDAALDLVEVSPNAEPPVVKLIDYGKFKYQAQKKAQEAKKKQTVIQIKEVQLRPNIEKHDLETKLKKTFEFLDEGDKVKLVMNFRGREMAYVEAGMEKFQGIMKLILEHGAIIEAPPQLLGKRISALLASSKKK